MEKHKTHRKQISGQGLKQMKYSPSRDQNNLSKMQQNISSFLNGRKSERKRVLKYTNFKTSEDPMVRESKNHHSAYENKSDIGNGFNSIYK